MGEASEGELILNSLWAVNFPMSIWYSAQKSLIVVAYAGAFTMPRITSVIDASISLSIVMFFLFINWSFVIRKYNPEITFKGTTSKTNACCVHATFCPFDPQILRHVYIINNCYVSVVLMYLLGLLGSSVLAVKAIG